MYDISFTRNRRWFLEHSAAVLGSWAVAPAFTHLKISSSANQIRLAEVRDESTGLSLLRLPPGFRYWSYSWTGDLLSDGRPVPGQHDGMGIIAERDGVLTICRNHEVSGCNGAFGERSLTYDPRAGGGCVNLRFDTRNKQWLSAVCSLSGTLKNCAGGPTPWGSWLSCEETVFQGGDQDDDVLLTLERPHGYIFEVSAVGNQPPAPLTDMGRFVHEAVAVDPSTGIVYETEDRKPAGFYRFLPAVPGELKGGGRLQMMRVAGRPDLIRKAVKGCRYDVDWVSIDDPSRAHSPGTHDEGGVFSQGHVQGATSFQKLEGCWWGDGRCYFVASHGGRSGKGQVWAYSPADETLQLIFESPGSDVLDCPDNLCVSPRGGLLLCEDGDRVPQKLQVLSPDGQLSEFAENNVVLAGERNGLSGNFRGSEWAGATFSSDGEWLFVNIQDPGITFAVTGDWASIGL
ncbi:MAG: DUF839 domain-containing protein [Planctomycetaceae bacterium]|nr:DUF839 domain-containing protein [Planctomycetaceae bacterium]